MFINNIFHFSRSNIRSTTYNHQFLSPHERARRQAEIDAYLEENSKNFDSFRTAPQAIRQDPLNFVGIQMIIFRLLPELFPEIWGPPGSRMAMAGYGPDPWDPSSVMPLGTGYILSEGWKPRLRRSRCRRAANQLCNFYLYGLPFGHSHPGGWKLVSYGGRQQPDLELFRPDKSDGQRLEIHHTKLHRCAECETAWLGIR